MGQCGWFFKHLKQTNVVLVLSTRTKNSTSSAIFFEVVGTRTNTRTSIVVAKVLEIKLELRNITQRTKTKTRTIIFSIVMN